MQSKHQEQERQLQQIVIDYFKDVDNATLVLFVDTFVYRQPISEGTGVRELFDNFLKDNGVEEAYGNYIVDLTTTSYFYTSSMSERDMINKLQNAFLNLCFNRFRKIDFKPKKEKVLKQPNKVKFLGDSDIEKSVHIVSNLHSDYTLCGILIEGDFAGHSENNTEEKIDCVHCKRIVKLCKSIEI